LLTLKNNIPPMKLPSMRCFRRTVLFAAAIPLVALAAVAQTPPSSSQGSIARALQPFVDKQVTPGCVALVASKDRVLCLETVGYSDLATKKPMQADNVFWIASMTKSLTGAALMMLVDEGKVSIDDPVEKYLPEFKGQMVVDAKDKDHPHPPKHPVTIREMMDHTSGLPQSEGLTSKGKQFTSLKDDIATYAAASLQWEPGSKFEYNNAGINTGGRIIEVISGMPYAQFMQERLLTPLGMKDTSFWPNQEQVQRIARAGKFNADKTVLENMDYNPEHVKDPRVPEGALSLYNRSIILTYINHYAMPAGGLFSTATDVMKFCQMLLNGGVSGGKRYLSEAAIKQMATDNAGAALVKPEEGYGVGCFVEKIDLEGHPSIGSFGHRGAWKTMMWVDPKKQLVMVLMQQCTKLSKEDEAGIYAAFIKAAEEKYGK